APAPSPASSCPMPGADRSLNATITIDMASPTPWLTNSTTGNATVRAFSPAVKSAVPQQSDAARARRTVSSTVEAVILRGLARPTRPLRWRDGTGDPAGSANDPRRSERTVGAARRARAPKNRERDQGATARSLRRGPEGHLAARAPTGAGAERELYGDGARARGSVRSEEHTSELQSLT